MDYSKLTPEQLLEMLKQGAPNLSNGMANIFSDEIYSENYPNLINSVAKGYDVGLMEDTYSDIASRFYNPETGEPANPGLSPADLVDFHYGVPGEANPFSHPIWRYDGNPLGGGDIEAEFPSSVTPYAIYNSDLLNTSTGEIVAMPGRLSTGYSDTLPDAVKSAAAILANNRQIGDSDYTIDDLRANGMSDEQLLEFLRNLTNKGYKI